MVGVPPHCDSLDGPVVQAARTALADERVERILPYVAEDGEGEVRDAFATALKVRPLGGEAADLADRWFFETVVRVHRAGEGAPYTGLKPAGLDVGPVIPVAERALETGAPAELTELLCGIVRKQIERRLAAAEVLKVNGDATVAEARAYVDAMLGLQVWAHGVYRKAIAEPHQHQSRAAFT
jgi:hypothetical protein